MRHLSGLTTLFTTNRKQYSVMSTAKQLRIAQAMGSIIEWPADQVQRDLIALDAAGCDGVWTVPEFMISLSHLTPAEERMLVQLVAWLRDGTAKAVFFTNLNSGQCVTFVAR